MTRTDDEGIRAIRDIREKISTECGNDPKKLVAHYLAEQERYRERLLQTVPAQQGDDVDDASHRG